MASDSDKEPKASFSHSDKKKKKDKRKHKKSNDLEKKHERKAKKAKLEESTDIPIEMMTKSKKMAPMTKEDWEKQQSVVRRVYDESSGRSRLIKGDGEVLEEIVSRDRHKAINAQATLADGTFFQSQININLKK